MSRTNRSDAIDERSLRDEILNQEALAETGHVLLLLIRMQLDKARRLTTAE